jgi:hypothetical protein
VFPWKNPTKKQLLWKKPKKTLVAIIAVAALAAVGYYFASNGFNFPAEEAEGSGIGGVKRAEKHRSEQTTASRSAGSRSAAAFAK